MAFLYTLLGIILFIVLLFLIPVRVTAHYEDTFEMTVQYGPIKIKLFPQKDKSGNRLSRRFPLIGQKLFITVLRRLPNVPSV